MKLRIEVNGHVHDISIEGDEATIDGEKFAIDARAMRVDDRTYKVGTTTSQHVELDGQNIGYRIVSLQGAAGLGGAGGGHGPVKAPMTGKVVEINVKEGQTVAAGDVLFVLEAMKMRNQVKASIDGAIGEIHVKVGAAVDSRTVIVDLVAP